MAAFLLDLHGWLRWVLLAAGAASAVWSGVTWVNRRGAGALDGRLSAIFVGLLDLQWLAGLVLFVLDLRAPDLTTRAFHGGLMTVAVLAAHLVRVRARVVLDRQAPPHFVVGALVPLLIIALGLRLW